MAAAGDNNSLESNNMINTITLRPMQVSDVDDLMAWATDGRVYKYTRRDAFTSRDEALDFIKNYTIPHPWFRVFCLDDNRPIGYVAVTPNPSDGADRCRAELGLIMAYEYWSKGIATKVVKMVSSIIFKEWPHLKRLEAFTYPENEGAQKVVEKAGFKREGLLRKFKTLKGKSRDLLVFSLLSSDIRGHLKVTDGGFRAASRL